MGVSLPNKLSISTLDGFVRVVVEELPVLLSPESNDTDTNESLSVAWSPFRYFEAQADPEADDATCRLLCRAMKEMEARKKTGEGLNDVINETFTEKVEWRLLSPDFVAQLTKLPGSHVPMDGYQ